LEERKNLSKFEEVRQAVAEQHALKNPDVTIELEKLRVTKDLHIEIPNLGTFQLTEWAKRQFGSVLGIQWDKWFDGKLVTHEQVQEELQRRFMHTKDIRKIRSNRFKAGTPGVPGCDGYIRAILGPTYHSIDDERLFDRLEKKFAGQLSELRFMSNHLSRKSRWGNDHCQHYTLVGQPINMGPINASHPDEKVRAAYDLATRMGTLPDNDYIYPGFHMRNSEVGFTAITIDEFSFRLVCTNGMMVTTGSSRLMYRQHRPIEDRELDGQFNAVFEKVPVQWETTRKKLGNLKDMVIDHPGAVIAEELKRLEAPKKFIDLAVKKWDEEPLTDGYGVIQAITRAAQDVEDMDKRFDYEAMAGQVMQRIAARASA
jgi:hypothetical protein